MEYSYVDWGLGIALTAERVDEPIKYLTASIKIVRNIILII